jgi:8-oxo-dGTP diphosphatase
MADRGDLILLRHALAGRKLGDPLRDFIRPLDRHGLATAAALTDAVLAQVRPSRIVSSPLRRCTETVRPLAATLDLDVEEHDALRVGADPEERDALLWAVPEHAVLCTHGEVLEQLFEGEVTCEKGGFWVVRRRAGRLLPLRYVAPPAAPVGRLVGAGSLATR